MGKFPALWSEVALSTELEIMRQKACLDREARVNPFLVAPLRRDFAFMFDVRLETIPTIIIIAEIQNQCRS